MSHSNHNLFQTPPANPTHQSPLDSEPSRSYITNLIKAGETNASIARGLAFVHHIGTTPDSIRRFRRRHELQIPGTERASTKISGDDAEVTTDVRTGPPVLDDPDAMLKQRGLDPEEWYIDAITVNEWDGPKSGGNKVTYYQAKFTAKRKKPHAVLMPVRSDGWTPTKRPTRRQADSELVVICGDQQAPFHDKNLHALFCEWLSANQPQRGVLLGDLGDFPDISRHPDDPENMATANECLQASYGILRDYVASSPNTEWEYLLGNHDERIRQYLVKNAPRAYDLHRVATTDVEAESVHSMSHLLRLDELGVKLIEPYGTYEDAQVALSENLAVRHGWIVRQGSGASALKTLETTGYSIIVGHTHRQSCVYHTYHEINRKARQLLAVEAGCMCRLDGRRDDTGRRFPNYSVHADWQQGFCTARIWPDDKFKVDLATYVNGVLFWGEQRYE